MHLLWFKPKVLEILFKYTNQLYTQSTVILVLPLKGCLKAEYFGYTRLFLGSPKTRDR